MDVPAKPEDFEFAREFGDLATELLASQKFVVHPVKVGSHGLEGVIDGLSELEAGKVNREKLVYRILGETA